MIPNFHISLRLLMVGLLILIVLAFLFFTAVSETSKPGRIVWIGYLEHQYSFSGGNSSSNAKNTAKYRYVEETGSDANTRLVEQKIDWKSLVERKIDWKSIGKATKKDAIIVDKESGGAGMRRFRGDFSVTCSGGGIVDMSSDDAYGQLEKMKPQCEQTPSPDCYGVFGKPWPPVWSSPPINIIPIPWDQLRNGCSYSEQKSWYDSIGGRNVQIFSVRVVETDAIVELNNDKEYKNFVPKPNSQILFDVRSSIPTLFRFTLEQVSNFSGYATNADVDDAFFNRYGLTHLRGKYGNKDPDLIFDPRYYDGSESFMRTGWNRVETVKEQENVSVIVTAMDYGAHGLLRVEAKTRCGWDPVRILVDGQDKDFITIPMDEDDNLIADVMSIYKGDPGRDDDEKPKGDSTPGDGFTSFEEYRGFMTRNGVYDCRDASKYVHVRTDPAWKDLFINTPSPMLLKLISLFSASSGLNVHNICPSHYVDNEQRVVNFTLQSGGPKVWQGKTISQKVPQHGLYLINASLPDGTLGETFSGDPARPKNVTVVKVDINQCLRIGRALSRIVRRVVGPILLANPLVHELGHSVGIPHHDDGKTINLEEALIITEEACPRGTTPVTKLTDYELPEGANACWAGTIARRHAQNSGDDKCPMKYVYWSYYESPSSPLKDVGNIQFQGTDGNQHELPGYTGNLRRYRMDLDFPGLGEFCINTRGSGINALPGDQNHAGDASHTCADKIHVNDVR